MEKSELLKYRGLYSYVSGAMKSGLIFITIAAICAFAPWRFASASPVNTRSAVTKSSALIKQKKYKEAISLLSNAVKQKPKNAVLQYYLGLACLYGGNHAGAQSALSKAVALTTNDSKLNKQAVDLIYKYWRYKPYSCLVNYLTPPKMVRWGRNKMPLAIWIADGKMLDNRLNKKLMTPNECMEIGLKLGNPAFMRSLRKSQFYKPSYRAAIVKGIYKWQWATRERLFTYTFTNNPAKADIIVFWSNELRGFGGWTYHPVVVPGKQFPGIIVMNLEDASEQSHEAFCAHLARIMVHEFGHVIGLDHSPNKEDIMYPKNSTAVFSKGDYATVRALYTLPSDFDFPSVSRPD